MMFGRRKAAATGEGLVVGPSDAVQGTVAAQAVTVVGRVDGTLDVAGALVVAHTGRVAGTLRATRLVIEPGASVRAACRVGAGADAVPLPEPARDVRAPLLRLTPRSTERVE
jgi:cytoskeletal protein CcmA (bactofilin family)